jgi:hypothetical protein
MGQVLRKRSDASHDTEWGGPYWSFKRSTGANDAYANITSGTWLGTGVGPLLVDTDVVPFATWWEVTFFVGLVVKQDAAYNYAYGTCRTVLPGPSATSDQDGISEVKHIVSQHNSVQLYEGRMGRRLFRVPANTNWQCIVYWESDGGTWQYYQGRHQLWMEGKQWRQ